MKVAFIEVRTNRFSNLNSFVAGTYYAGMKIVTAFSREENRKEKLGEIMRNTKNAWLLLNSVGTNSIFFSCRLNRFESH